MSIKSVGDKISALRNEAGFSQEKLCESDFCSLSELSAIENGKRILSPITYQCLTQYMGIYQSPFPEFLSIADYRCYMLFFKVRFFVESWHISEALETLKEIEKYKFADNKYYYQKWLMYYALLMEISGDDNIKLRTSIIEKALSITRNNEKKAINLTITELQLYVCLGNIYLLNRDKEKCDLVISIISKNEWINNRSIHEDALNISIKIFKHQYMMLFFPKRVVESEIEESNKEAINTYLSFCVLRMSGTYACAMFLNNRKNEGREALENFRAGCSLYRAYYGDELYMIANNDTELKRELPDFIISRYRKTIDPPNNYDVSQMGDGKVDAYNYDKITIGRIIGLLRKEQNLSYSELGEGICSKSWIYKIENDYSYPRIMQVNALLQRLGIVDQVFDFLGSPDEVLFYEYRNTLVRNINVLTKKEIANILNRMEKLKNGDNKLGKQFILFIKAAFLTSPTEMYDKLVEAIKITQPSYENGKLTKRLSWTEFNIVQYIYRCKYKNNPKEGIVLTAGMITRLLSYKYSIEQYQFSVPILYNSLAQYLYNEKMYTALDSLSNKYEEPLLKYYMDALSLYMCVHLKSKLKRKQCMFDREAEINYIGKCLKILSKNKFYYDIMDIYNNIEMSMPFS